MPDSRKGISDRKDQVIRLLDSRFGTNTNNGKLATHPSGKDNHIKRKHEKTHLSAEFRKIFSNVANRQHIIDKISLNVPQLERKLIPDAEIVELDKNQSLQGTLLIGQSDAMNLQNRFDSFAREMTEPFAKEYSRGIIRRCIHQLFEKNTKVTDLMDTANITLSPKNKDHFIRTISESKSQFARDVAEKINRETEDILKWNVPKYRVRQVYDKKDYKKMHSITSLYQNR